MILITIIVHHLNIFIISSVVDHFSIFGQLYVYMWACTYIYMFAIINLTWKSLLVCIYACKNMCVYLHTSDCESDYFLRKNFIPTAPGWESTNCLKSPIAHWWIAKERSSTIRAPRAYFTTPCPAARWACLGLSFVAAIHSCTRPLLPRTTGMEGGGPITKVLLHLLLFIMLVD